MRWHLAAPLVSSLVLAAACSTVPWESPSSRLGRVERKVDALMEAQLAQATDDDCHHHEVRHEERRTRRTHRERRSIRVDRGPLGELTVDELARMGRALLHRDEDGVFDGYRLSAIRSDSLPYTLGLRSGDVVHRVNGMPLSSMEAALQAWVSAQDDEVLHVDLTRGETSVELTIHLSGKR